MVRVVIQQNLCQMYYPSISCTSIWLRYIKHRCGHANVSTELKTFKEGDKETPGNYRPVSIFVLKSIQKSSLQSVGNIKKNNYLFTKINVGIVNLWVPLNLTVKRLAKALPNIFVQTQKILVV